MARTLIVSDRHNSFFSTNNIRVGNQIPTEGNYVKGDIIVNIGENTTSEAMWICVESGNPGIWEVVGAGAGGNGGSDFVSINNTVFVNEPVNEVELGLGVAITSKDKLIVHHNSIHLMQDVDYRIEGNKIVKLTEGNWNEDSEEAMFAFELFKNVESVDGSLVEVKTKLVCMQNTVTVQGAVREVLIGIQGFNKDYDTLMVFENETFLTRGVNYEINEAGNGIVPVGGEVWNDIMIDDWSYTFVVFKDVPLVEGESKIGMGQLAEDVKEAIENASNIDLSGYATKEEMGEKVAQTEYDAKIAEIEARVEEAFTSANNGKELIASAIGEPVSAEDTFSAMSNGINGLLSTFKTNMMNNGVMVESSDKFKALIDKIATMVEESGNKGIKILHSVERISFNSSTQNSTIITHGLGYVPTFVYCGFKSITNYPSSGSAYRRSEDSCFVSTNAPSTNVLCTDSSAIATISLTDVNENSFTISHTNSYGSISGFLNEWYAIGVGEEDTTLRDSLASILQGEGVSVTNEDTMASLISKVDQEFDRQVVPQGNAGPEHVLQGVSFMNSSGTVQSGNIPILASNIANDTNINSYNHYMTGEIQVGDYSGLGGNCVYFAIPQYWYTSVPWITSYCPDLRPENIVSGKNILGVWGSANSGIYHKSLYQSQSIKNQTATFNINHNLGKQPSRVLVELSAMWSSEGASSTIDSSVVILRTGVSDVLTISGSTAVRGNYTIPDVNNIIINFSLYGQGPDTVTLKILTIY